MQRMIQHLYMVPLFISMFLSFKSFRMKWPPPYRTFSILLITISGTELLAYLWKFFFFNLRNWPYSQSNLWLYNSFLIPQYLGYMAVYYQALESVRIKKTIIGLAIAYAVLGLLNNFFLQGIHNVDSYTVVMAGSIVIFMTVAWFNQTLRGKELIRLQSHPMTWISLGALIFHAAELPYILSLNYLVRINIPLALALFYIYLSLNCIMYTAYIIAFLCQTPPRS